MHIFGPMKIDTFHWVLFVANVAGKKYELYDPFHLGKERPSFFIDQKNRFTEHWECFLSIFSNKLSLDIKEYFSIIGDCISKSKSDTSLKQCRVIYNTGAFVCEYDYNYMLHGTIDESVSPIKHISRQFISDTYK